MHCYLTCLATDHAHLRKRYSGLDYLATAVSTYV